MVSLFIFSLWIQCWVSCLLCNKMCHFIEISHKWQENIYKHYLTQRFRYYHTCYCNKSKNFLFTRTRELNQNTKYMCVNYIYSFCIYLKRKLIVPTTQITLTCSHHILRNAYTNQNCVQHITKCQLLKKIWRQKKSITNGKMEMKKKKRSVVLTGFVVQLLWCMAPGRQTCCCLLSGKPCAYGPWCSVDLRELELNDVIVGVVVVGKGIYCAGNLPNQCRVAGRQSYG